MSLPCEDCDSPTEHRLDCIPPQNPKAYADQNTATRGGQFHKEFSLNKSLVTIDALLPRTVEGVLEAPPEAADDGDCFLVGPTPSGEWAGKSDCLVIRMGEGWHFIEPRKGMEVFDQSSERKLIYLSQWFQPLAPSQPIGGSTIDVEARSAINDLVASFQSLGVIG